MTDIKHLFFAGNKRCGTTVMVNLLNLHPNVFVSHESDIIWILYQLSRGRVPRQHPHEGWLGMRTTLRVCASIIDEATRAWTILRGQGTPVAVFRKVTEYLMHHGSEIQRKYDKPDLLWIGDKKPVQCSDPEVTPFLQEHFPNAHYVHMVRHPRAYVACCTAAAKRAIAAGDTRGLPEYCRMPPASILEIWAEHEEWALQVEKECRTARILLEDLCYSPVMVMRDLFGFLGLDMSDSVVMRVMQMVHPGPNTKYDGAEYDLEMTPRVMRLMGEYGYD